MKPRTARLIVWALVIGHLLLASAYSVLNPLGEAPDEADHWAYVVHLARERELPQGPKMTQAKHPPLYHATAAAVASLAEVTNDFLRINPDTELAQRPDWSPNFFIHTASEAWPWRGGVLAFHLARLWSVLLSTATVAAVYGLARAALPQRTEVVLAATAIAAFAPEFAFIGAAVSNDSMAALFGTLGLWGGLRIYHNGGRFRPAWWAVPALGLGLLAKVSTGALWPVIGLAVVLGAADGRGLSGAWRRWLATGLLLFVPALLIAAPWLLRNWQLYGDPLGAQLVRQTVDLRAAPWSGADTLWLLRGWFVSSWGKFGGAGHIPMAGWLYAVLAGVTLAAAAGIVRLYLRPDWRAERTPLALLLLAVAAIMVGIWQYSLTALGTDQGRLLFPAIGSLVILLAAGLLAWLPARAQAAGAGVIAAAVLALGCYGLFGVLIPAFAPPAPAPAAEWQAAATSPVTFGELTLAGYRLTPQPLLYWQAGAAPPTQDWRSVLRVTAEDGSLVWEWRRSPGAGRWSTDRWPAGVTLRDEYRIAWPEWAGRGRYRVEVGLQPYDQELIMPLSSTGQAAENDHPYFLLGWLER